MKEQFKTLFLSVELRIWTDVNCLRKDSTLLFQSWPDDSCCLEPPPIVPCHVSWEQQRGVFLLWAWKQTVGAYANYEQ